MLPVKNFDQTFCGNLPLHLTNLVQSHGALLIIDTSNFHILQSSENIDQFVGIPVAYLIDRPLTVVFPEDVVARITAKIQSGKSARLPVNLRVDKDGTNVHLLGLLHPKENYAIIEIEQRSDNRDDQDAFLDFYQKLRHLTASIESASSVEEACVVVVKELSVLTGYDRVMVYRFDSDWNGTVVAESINSEGLEPYLGLKFPASDVPKPARDLYHRIPYRLIPDRTYKPSRLYPVLNPITGGFTDLSDCNLRSVANVHLEYMHNMGVDASMSIRIISDDKLWGLISCHHKTSKFLDFEMCSVLELLSNVFSAKLSALYSREDFQLRSNIQDVLIRLLKQVDNYGLTDGFLNHSTSLLTLLNVSGAAFVLNGHIFSAGIVPAEASITELTIWLETMVRGTVFYTSELSAHSDVGAEITREASGVIAIPVSVSISGYVLGFRQELLRTVTWGGNPNEAVQFEQGTRNYHPRSSFEQWQQSVRNTSLPWEAPVVDIAEKLRIYLMEYSLKKA